MVPYGTLPQHPNTRPGRRLPAGQSRNRLPLAWVGATGFQQGYNYNMITKKHITEEDAKLTGERLGIRWDKFNIDQFRIGMEVELEHGTIKKLTNVSNDHLLTTAKIALAHLNEIPDYYTRLLKMEKEAKKQTPK